MQVAGDEPRLDGEHVEQQAQVRREGAQGELGVEVSEMRREERLGPPGDAEGALELRARRDERPRAATGSGSPAGA